MARQGTFFRKELAMESIELRMVGQSPLLMHNGQLANPFNDYSKQLKEITAKKKKTEEDQMQIMRIEWEGGLYFDPKVGPYVPAENLESMINDGARLLKRGMDVERGVYINEKKVPLLYEGPRTIEGLWKAETFIDYRSVVNPSSGGRTMRARPIFREWGLELIVHYRNDVVSRDDIIRFLRDAGEHKGLMDHRPRYGQFSIEVVAEGSAIRPTNRRQAAVAQP
jgi:hypothetical protein